RPGSAMRFNPGTIFTQANWDTKPWRRLSMWRCLRVFFHEEFQLFSAVATFSGPAACVVHPSSRGRCCQGFRMIKPAVMVGLGEVLWDLLPSGKVLGGAPANFAYMANALGDKGVVASRVGVDP